MLKKWIHWSHHLKLFDSESRCSVHWVSLTLSPLGRPIIPQSYITAISRVQYLGKCFTGGPSPLTEQPVCQWMEYSRYFVFGERSWVEPAVLRGLRQAVESVSTASSVQEGASEWASGTTEALACCLSYQCPPILPPTHVQSRRKAHVLVQWITHSTY